ncbi:MAG TPA: hypothetical protein VFT45_15980 [Longimicrobium sp.]|nr:hypothetical protein [Longimicrobium sp.]
MKKLKLELDALKVETFSTGSDIDGKGTVEGFYAQQPEPTTSLNDQITCGNVNTCNGALSCVSCSWCLGEPTDELA